jgi:hypothetical protein
MADDLPTHLQALYHSGNVSEFICARMPSGKLTTGWMEQGLLHKGFTGKLRDKKNQEQLIIPADRFARLTRDLQETTHAFIGLLIIGNKGLRKPKFCVLVYPSSDNTTEFMTTVAFWTKNLNLQEITHSITRYAFSRNHSVNNNEPDLDYVEQLQADVSSGKIQNLLSLRIKPGKLNITEWLRSSIKQVDTSKEVVAHAGEIESLSNVALLFSRWITSLELFKKSDDNIAAILMKFDDRIESCLWDSPQNLVTFTTMEDTDFEYPVNRYCSSMWTGSEDFAPSGIRSPEVVVGTEMKSAHVMKKTKAESLERINTISLRDLINRINALEIELQKLDSLPSDQSANLDQSFSIIQTRLVETIDRLESLANRLSDLETRLRSISNTGR